MNQLFRRNPDHPGVAHYLIHASDAPQLAQMGLAAARRYHIRGTLGAHCVIPAPPRRGIPEGEIRYQMYRAFPRPLYGPRAKIETVFSVIKRKLSAKAPGRSLPVQVRQALLLGLTFNLYRLRHHRVLRGCQQSQSC